MPEPTTETTVDLNGVRLYTRRAGEGPPVVVLHGGPGAHHDYLLPQYDHLTEAAAPFSTTTSVAAGGHRLPARSRSAGATTSLISMPSASPGRSTVSPCSATRGAGCWRCCMRSSIPTGLNASRSSPPRP